MRYLLVEAAQAASRIDPELRRGYHRLKFRRGSAVAKVAIPRKLMVEAGSSAARDVSWQAG